MKWKMNSANTSNKTHIQSATYSNNTEYILLVRRKTHRLA